MPQLPALTAPSAYDIAEKSPDEIATLRRTVRVGYSAPVSEGGRGKAWWDSGMPDGTHFDGPVPQSEVDDILGVPITSHRLFAEIDGEMVLLDDRQGIAVNKKIVNDRSDGYQIHQYHETLNGFVQSIRRDAEVGVSTVARLKDDCVCFIQAVLPETHEIQGFGYQPYITAATSADSSICTDHFAGGKAAVCRNTFDMAAAGALVRFKVKHGKNSLAQLVNARERLGVQLHQVADGMDEMIQGLTEIDVTDDDFNLWLDEMQKLPEPDLDAKNGKGRAYGFAERKRDELTRLAKKDPMCAPWYGTGLGILQTASTYRIYSGKVQNAAGGRVERNLLNDVTSVTAKSDSDALAKLAKVQERRLVTV